VPIIIEDFQPESVVDIGCGTGTWLSVFERYGIKSTFGVDGHHVDQRLLEFAEELFYSHDLREPLYLDRSFDVVLCLEVAEHLPVSYAETLIDSLVRLGDIIVFSAAIPFQGGRRHLNEQWPDYLVQLFRDRDFGVHDLLRGRIWRDPRVEPWYRQNILVYIRNTRREQVDVLSHQNERDYHAPIAIVHPELYLSRVRRAGLLSKARDRLSKVARRIGL
jgi:SAM-dependent methyltransferase